MISGEGDNKQVVNGFKGRVEVGEGFIARTFQIRYFNAPQEAYVKLPMILDKEFSSINLGVNRVKSPASVDGDEIVLDIKRV